VDAQEAEIRRIANRRNATVVQIFIDIGPENVPLEELHGMDNAVEAVKKGEASLVIAAEPSRLARSAPTLARFVTRVEKAGGEVAAEVEIG